MPHFDSVTANFGDLKYMDERRAKFLRDFIIENDVSDVLEIGFHKGKSSAYFAAALEDRGKGHLVTIDKARAKKLSPNIHDVVTTLGLSHRVTPIFAERSHTWELAKMVRTNPRPQFDMCYFDGGHTWDVTGFGFVLVDMLLSPGGWIIFDDLDWTISKSLVRTPARAHQYRSYSNDEREAPGVRMVFELLVPHLGYINLREEKRFSWGIARKSF
jgi:predicted O-methyltransferase YrrM